MDWRPQLLYLTVGFVLSFIITTLTRNSFLSMISDSGFVRPNYKQENIPLAAGAIFFIAALTTVMPLFFLWAPALRHQALAILFAMGGATVLGLIDDFWGSREASGLLGHFKSLLKGRLTTGAVKALAGGTLSLILGAYLYPGNMARIIDSTLIIALSVNLVNLFDLRPGRAGKVYIFLYLILLPASWSNMEAVLGAIVLGSLVAYFPADLKARAMMGDAGSNALGVVIGVTAAACLEGYWRAGYLAMLVIMHLITERYSLTRIISGNALLNYLDMLGREKEPKK